MRRPTRPHRTTSRPVAVERLESRALLASFLTAGTVLTIDLTKAGTLAVASSGAGSYLFTLEGGDTFAGADAAGLVGNTLPTLTVTPDLDITQVSVTNSAGTTAVRFTDSAGPYDDSFTVTMKGIAGLPGWVPSVKFVGSSAFAGAAALNVSAPTIAVEAAKVSTAAGTLSLVADTGAAVTGNFTGLALTSASSVESESGAITLRGRGGDGATGNQKGISIGAGSSVAAGVADGMAVAMKLTGIGGSATGTGGSNHGIVIETGGAVSATGLLELDGTGGPTNAGNRGVLVSGSLEANSMVIKGTGGGTSGDAAADNHGVFIGNQALVSADGLISVIGTTGPGKATTTTPYVSSSGLFLNSARVNSASDNIQFQSDSFRLQGTGTVIASNKTVFFTSTADSQLMPLDKPVNTVLARTYAKDISYGSEKAVVEQEVASAGGALVIGTANLTVLGSAIRLRTNVTSGGAQTWNGPVILGAPSTTPATKATEAGDVRLEANGITLLSTVDGAKNLTLAAGSSPIVLSRAVGKTTPLASLRVDSATSVKAASTLAIDGSAAGAAASGLSFASGVTGIDMQIPGSTIANAAAHGISLAATSNSSLAGFAVKNAGVSGIRATGAMPATKITATRVEGGGKTAFGAVLSDATGLSFGTATSGNTITGVSSGIIAKGDMSGSTIRSNNVTLNSGGINLLAARGLRVMGNNVSGNSLYGVRADGNNAGTAVTGNVITGSTFGVFLDGAKSLQLGAPGSGNVVQAGINPTTGTYDPTRPSYGLHATGDLTGTAVVANSIIDNTIGVRLTDARGLSVKDGNLLFRNRFQAIAASGTSTSTIIARNTIEGSLPDTTRAPFGIVLDSATGLTVGGEAATDANGIFSTSTAVLARGNLTGSAIKRSIIRTMNNGVVLASARGLWVQSNDVNGAVQQGLNASGDCTGTTVLFNRIVGGASGVVIDAARSLLVTNNVIDANRVGVFATGNCPGTKVADNAVVSNGTNLSTSTAAGGWFQPS